MNLWNYLETKKITDRPAIEKYLLTKLGKPSTEIQTNLLSELTKKINSYYQEPENQNYTTHSLIGSVQEISERFRKTGKRKGQVDYDLELSTKEILQARKEDLPPDKWKQIEKMTILGKNSVFKYKKYFANKQIIDFCLQAKNK